MFNKKTRKGAFLSCLVVLILCCSMFIGTTFAWFTDAVESYNNIITAGNLDVELYYQNDETSGWTKVDANTNVFKNSLWEPGHTEVVMLKVVNEGTLALKYQLSVNIAEEECSVNLNGDWFELSDYIKFGVVEGEQSYGREDAVDAVEATANSLKAPYCLKNIALLAGEEKIITLVVYMPASVGNEANYNTDEHVKTPKIKLGINLCATQDDSEVDSFGPDYDENAAPHDEYVYFATLFDAVSAVNAIAVSESEVKQSEALAAVYKDENDEYHVVLLDDHTTEEQVVVESDMTIDLMGNKLTGSFNGVIMVTSGNLTINGNQDGSSIVALQAVGTTMVRAVRILGGHTTINEGSYVAYSDYGGENTSQGINVGLGATATFNNIYVYGVHAGLQANASITVNGGTYEGYSHGGFYFNGSNTTSYVMDAQIRQAPMTEGYKDIGGGCVNGGMYVGGTGGKENITVYMDNCDIYGKNQAIALRGSSGEQNTNLYISNSTINLDYKLNGVRIDKTHTLHLGVGNNFTAKNTSNPDAVVIKDETYRK